ncbi:unnamed protein product [Schistosoma spindalis]|nr:unnamed protein product [Schistosoma spindale]
MPSFFVFQNRDFTTTPHNGSQAQEILFFHLIIFFSSNYQRVNSKWFKMVQMVVDGIEEAFAKWASVSNSSGSSIPLGRNLGILKLKKKKEIGKS